MDRFVKSYTNPDGSEVYRFHCPGCKCSHLVPVTGPKAWFWNKSTEKPTINPSVLVNGHNPKPDEMTRCHSFVVDGRIQFLQDSEHELAGQTVDLPDPNPEVLFPPDKSGENDSRR